jgi:hypothetical protein
MIGLPKTFKAYIQDPVACKLLTGFAIAAVEATVTCPLERIKVYFMTQQQSQTYFTFLISIQGSFRKELFRGFTPLFLR